MASFSGLHHRQDRAYRSEAQDFEAQLSWRGSEGAYSEDSQVSYIAQKGHQPRRRPRSAASNKYNASDDSLQRRASAATSAIVADNTWNVIHRDISELQYVCKEERPYWWLQSTRDSRSRRLYDKHKDWYTPRRRIKDVCQREQLASPKLRRAATDSYLSAAKLEDGVRNDVQVVAIQLLSACFTLSPISVDDVPFSRSTRWTQKRDAQKGRPRFVSSLQMYTQFSYSPSFGHRARSSSPVQQWPGMYDGPYGNTSPILAELSTPDLVESMVAGSGETPHHRYTTVTDMQDSEDERHPSIESNFSGNNFDGHNVKLLDLPDNLCGDHSRSIARRTRISQSSTDDDGRDSYGIYFHPYGRINSSSKPVIQSEPLPVLIQPVRDLALRRWRTFRRRIGCSLHTTMPGRDLKEHVLASETATSSPKLISNARRRRMRARESGDIHSSTDSAPRYNTPVSKKSTPCGSGTSSPYSSGAGEIPLLGLSGDVEHTISRHALEAPSLSPSASISQHDNLDRRNYPAGALALSSSSGMASQAEASFCPSARQTHLLQTNQYPSKKGVSRTQRKSALSEMYVPEGPPDNTGTTMSGPITDALATPKDEVNLHLLSTEHLSEAFNSPSSRSIDVANGGEARPLKPSIIRTTTSGTQVITSNVEGVVLGESSVR